MKKYIFSLFFPVLFIYNKYLSFYHINNTTGMSKFIYLWYFGEKSPFNYLKKKDNMKNAKLSLFLCCVQITDNP